MLQFDSTLFPSWVRITASAKGVNQIPTTWMSLVSTEQSAVAAHLLSLVDSAEEAEILGECLQFSHAQASRLSERMAQIIGLPSRSPYVLSVQNEGVVNGHTGFRVHCRLTRADGRAVVFQRTGAFIILSRRRVSPPFSRSSGARNLSSTGTV